MDLCTDYRGRLSRSRGGCVPTTLGTWLARLHLAHDRLPKHHGTEASLTCSSICSAETTMRMPAEDIKVLGRQA